MRERLVGRTRAGGSDADGGAVDVGRDPKLARHWLQLLFRETFLS